MKTRSQSGGLIAVAAVVLVSVACGGAPADQITADRRPGPVAAGGAVAITNVTIVDVADGEHAAGMSVLIKGREIAEISRELAVPPGAAQLDGTGKFLIPGLWDMHTHHQGTGIESLDLFPANGVTGTRDMGADAEFILALRERINRDELLGPEIVATGPILDDRPAHWPFRRRVASPEAAREAVRDLKKRGVDFIKVHDGTPRDVFFAIADEVTKVQLPLVGHVPNGVRIEEAIDAGIKSIEHLANYRVLNDCSLNPPHHQISCDALFGKLASSGVWQTPTLTFFQLIPDMFSGKPLPHADYASDSLLELTRANVRESKLDEQALSFFRTNNQTSLPRIHDLFSRGVRFLAACDGLVPGFCLHDELEWFTTAGFTPLQALQTATVNPAMFLGRERTQGTIDVGKRADLVMLDDDPLTDIRNTRRIAAVVVRGRLLAKPDLDRIVAAHTRTSPAR